MTEAELKDYKDNLLKYYRNPDPESAARIEHGPELYRKGQLSYSFLLPDGKPLEGEASVEYKQVASEYEFGCNGFMLGEFETAEENEAYENYFKGLFNQMTIPFYWGDLEPEQGKPRYDKNSPKVYRRPPPDLCLEFCEKNGIKPKGHLLIYDHHNPTWLKRDTTEALKRQFERHVREIAERYGDRIQNWDVTNEITYNTPSQFIPEDFGHFAFDLAQKYFPVSTRFNYNDGSLWRDHNGYYSVNNMLENWLIESGRRIDCIGVQLHMIGCLDVENMLPWWGEYYYYPEYLNDVLDIYSKVGKPLTISEVTVDGRVDLGEGNEEFQRESIEALYKLWFAHPNTNGIIYWNLVDDTALGVENNAKGGLIRRDMTAKPAYEALRKLILNDWRTSGTATYRPNGKNYIRGYYGTYEISVTTKDGKRYTATEKIIAGRKNTAKIQLA